MDELAVLHRARAIGEVQADSLILHGHKAHAPAKLFPSEWDTTSDCLRGGAGLGDVPIRAAAEAERFRAFETPITSFTLHCRHEVFCVNMFFRPFCCDCFRIQSPLSLSSLCRSFYALFLYMEMMECYGIGIFFFSICFLNFSDFLTSISGSCWHVQPSKYSTYL